MTLIPESPAGITSKWLTRALRKAGHITGETVTITGIEPVGAESGFASRMARITVSGEAPHLPSSLIVKMHAPDQDAERMLLLKDKYAREAAFYSMIWPHAGCRTPFCYFVAHQAEPPRFVMLLEDLNPARFGDAAAGWTHPDAVSVVEALASLHAAWWKRPALDAWEWLPRFGNADEQLEKFTRRRTTFLERYGSELSDTLTKVTMGIGPRHAERLRRLGGLPHTLLHVDTHLDNIAFVHEDGAEAPVLFDWQGMAKGMGVVDLSAFLLGGSTAERRRWETDLIDRYHRTLVSAGVTDYPGDALLADYSLALLRWWVGTVNGMGSRYAAAWSGRQADLAVQAVRRWNAVAEDHVLTGGPR